MTAPARRTLGCASRYHARVYRWDRAATPTPGLRLVTELGRLDSLSWERLGQDSAEATVVFTLDGSRGCDRELFPDFDARGQLTRAGVWPWAHEVALYRDGDRNPVFMGPITSMSGPGMTGEGGQVAMGARDVLGYLDVRLTHQDMWYQDAGEDRPIAWGRQDPAVIAQWLLEQATAQDDPGLRQAVLITPVPGVSIQRTGRAREFTVGAEFRDLARAGVVYYSVGRRAYLHGDWQPYAGQRLRRLSSQDFAGPVGVEISTAATATAVSVVGAVPPGTTDQANTVPAKVYLGGPDTFFGLVERLQPASRTTDEATLRAIGQRVVGLGNPPPMSINVDSGAVLLPSTPVGLEDLVPNQWFELAVGLGQRRIRQVMRLTHLKVDWTPETGEKVQVAFMPPSITQDPE